ncbi:glutamine amidotransferase of anthranilate synthase [Psychromonas sp. CNPT3]|uniref:aminodeoxychorismate/anthranilate synthase component II n=1 Tax=Psychromonas sp. CNPT3 TaxID=314282 RepID=UPI00006E34B4|nr:aminodeoxychorismate/anthranilate synthase component II [Psychromonas sp. CNPT3]AGH80729.1 glutamine amidotransferase of anthranilate synthase [Psychromonas sp. CNPT3]
MQTSPKSTLYFLDNFDSFTYNLVDQFKALGHPVKIFRNNQSAQKIKKHMDDCPDNVLLVLSPGPGAPSDAGCLIELIKLCRGNIPMLGICLGHQALIEQYGGRIIKSAEIVHGKSSLIQHCNNRMFANLPLPLCVARYHSLVGTDIPDELEVIADFNGMCMGVYHAKDRVLGFQFHPESILTCEGAQLLQNSLHFLLQEGAH